MGEFTLWLTFVGLIALIQGFQHTDHRLNIITAIVSIIFGIRSFLGHGGALVTVLGLFNYSLALFVGLGGAFAALNAEFDTGYFELVIHRRLDAEHLGTAIQAGLTLQILTTFLGWRGQPRNQKASLPNQDAAKWLTRWGAISLAILALWRLTNVTAQLNAIIEATAFAAIVLLTVGLLYREDARLFSYPLLAIIGALVVYMEVFHTGGGRLRIVALACAVGLLVSMRFHNRSLKRIIVLATPLMLIYLAQQRLAFQETLSTGASDGRHGLESMLVPVAAFARLLEEQAEGLPLAWGWNLLSMPLSFFPASWLHDAPQALGYELVAFYAPSRYDSGYSVAATAAGEAVYNFGPFGILIAAPVIAWLCNRIDRMIRRQVVGPILNDRAHLVRLALWVTLGGAISDLAWNGWHVYAVRTLLRLPLLAVVGVIAALHHTTAHERTSIATQSTASEPDLNAPANASRDEPAPPGGHALGGRRGRRPGCDRQKFGQFRQF